MLNRDLKDFSQFYTPETLTLTKSILGLRREEQRRAEELLNYIFCKISIHVVALIVSTRI